MVKGGSNHKSIKHIDKVNLMILHLQTFGKKFYNNLSLCK